MLEEFLNPLRLPQRVLDALDSLGDIAQDLGALREGVGSGLETLEETTTSIHGDMTELSTQLEGLTRMEETTVSIHGDMTQLSTQLEGLARMEEATVSIHGEMTELSTQLEGLARMEETTASIHGDMTELSKRLEGLARMEDALNDGLAELSARVKRLSKQLEILPTPQLDKGDPFPEFTLEGADGPVELREYWSDGPLAVAFMRHMGCSFCREHLAQLDQAREEIRAAGGEVVVIFQNRGGDARGFCDERHVGLECLGDPRREGYAAVALKKGSWKEYIGPQIMMRQWQAVRSGYKPGVPKGDVSQRPGTFVVGTDGLIVFAHYNRDSSDNPTTDKVLAAVREAAGAGTDGDAATHRPVAIAPVGAMRSGAPPEVLDRLTGTGGRLQRNGASPEAGTCRPDQGRRLGRGKC